MLVSRAMIRHSHRVRRGVRPVLLGLALVLGAAGASCRSTYDRAAEMLPPDPGERAALRMRDADRAAQEARTAAATLAASLASGDAARAAVDADRVQVRASELRRRVLSARDAGGVSDPGMVRALASHERLAADLSRAVEQARSGQTAAARRTLADAGAAGPES